MDSGREMSIGQRIALYRKARGLTQESLAMRLNRSKSWVTKIERGERPIDSIPTILQVARALGVEIQQLTGRPYFPEPSERGTKSEGLYPLRRVLMRYDAIHGTTHRMRDGLPPPIADLRREAERARQLYNRSPNNFSAVVPFLPALIGQAQLAARQASERDRGVAHAVLANLYRLAALELRQYGDMDLGWIAADRALLAAGHSGDDLLVASCAASMTVQLMVQGQPEEAVGLAMDGATAIGPHLTKSKSPKSLAIWGALHLYAAQAAARADDPKESRRLLEIATAAAEELGADREEYWLFFGPTNVGIQEAGILVDLTEPVEALRRAATVDPNRLPSVNRRCYYHLHAARANGLRRQDHEAIRELLAAEQVAPELVRWDPMARELVHAMLERERRSLNPNLRGLAGRLGMLT
jgi:transcriptional regulator with XRE-family HTH domain